MCRFPHAATLHQNYHPIVSDKTFETNRYVTFHYLDVTRCISLVFCRKSALLVGKSLVTRYLLQKLYITIFKKMQSLRKSLVTLYSLQKSSITIINCYLLQNSFLAHYSLQKLLLTCNSFLNSSAIRPTTQRNYKIHFVE